MSKNLDIEFVRNKFPVFRNPKTKELAFFENAGGTYVPGSVINKLNKFMTETKVQPYGDFSSSIEAGNEMDNSINKIAELLNIEKDEFIIGPSTTMNMFLLSRAIKHWLSKGDEIIVTNQDHEANIGAWRKLADEEIVVKEWSLNKDSAELEIEELKSLINEKTKLICVCHTSNIVASINNLKEIVDLAHKNDIKVVGDGVAYMAHDLADLKEIDLDFYGFSLYKTFGPHLALLYGKKELLEETKNLNHEFLSKEIPLTLNPGGPNHEELACLSGLTDYYEDLYNHHFSDQKINLHEKGKAIFKLVYSHEEQLMEKLLSFLKSKNNVKLIGKSTHLRSERMPTVSFTVNNKSSLSIAQEAGKNGIGISNGDFYAWRCLKGLGIDTSDGVIRISMVHYNNMEEVEKLIKFLEINI
jgi:cysteine desulfurase family protein (TIGR01976 family)